MTSSALPTTHLTTATCILINAVPTLNQTRPTGKFSLPDPWHDLTDWVLHYLGFSDEINWHHIPDLFVAWVSAFTMAFVLMHPRRFLILRRVTIIFGILFFFRSLTVLMTALPDPSPVCRRQFGVVSYKRLPMFPRVFYRAFKFMMSPTTVRAALSFCSSVSPVLNSNRLT